MTASQIGSSAEDRGPAWQDTNPTDRPGEVWKPIPEFDGYQVSNQGRVRSLDRVVVHKNGFRQSWPGKIRKQVLHRREVENNYPRPRLVLWKNSKNYNRYVHRLVAEAFIGPCPDGMEVCHGDGDPMNNNSLNLRYDTPSANNLDAIRHGNYRNPAWSGDTPPVMCLRGHALAVPNLRVGGIKIGQRKCLACQRTYNRVNSRLRRGSELCTDLQVVSDEAYAEILDAAGKTHEQLLEEAQEYVSERFAGFNPHENPSDRSEGLRDPKESQGDHCS